MLALQSRPGTTSQCGTHGGRTPTPAAPRAAPASPLRLREAVKGGYILDKNSCFDFTWLNNKSSRERRSRRENKAQHASPDAGGSALQPVGSADWLASRMAQEY